MKPGYFPNQSTGRCTNIYPHQSDLGDQNPHVIHWLPGSGSVFLLCIWRKADLSHRRCAGVLSRPCPCSVWGQPWGSSIHGIRTIEGSSVSVGATWVFRRVFHQGAGTRKFRFLYSVQSIEGLCRLRHLSLPSDQVAPSDV